MFFFFCVNSYPTALTGELKNGWKDREIPKPWTWVSPVWTLKWKIVMVRSVRNAEVPQWAAFMLTALIIITVYFGQGNIFRNGKRKWNEKWDHGLIGGHTAQAIAWFSGSQRLARTSYIFLLGVSGCFLPHDVMVKVILCVSGRCDCSKKGSKTLCLAQWESCSLV